MIEIGSESAFRPPVSPAAGWLAAALAALLLMLAGGLGAPAMADAAAPSASFGKTSVGAAPDPMSPDRKRVNAYVLPAAGAVTKLTIYLQPGGAAGAQAIKGLIYAGGAGGPGALLASTSEVVFHSTDAAGWYDFPLSAPLNLAAGTYWLGLMSGAPTHVAAFRYDSVPSSRDYNANPYTASASDPFGAFLTDDEQASIYATYTPAVQTPPTVTLGKATIGASADSFAPDRKRVNAYPLSTGGTLTKLDAYLAPGGATGQQTLKGVVYANAGGSPGALLATTGELTFNSTQSPGWYDLPLSSPLAVSPATYWIGVITGPATHVVGFRYDSVPGARAVSANPYSSGPSDPFGPFSVDNEQMSLYATVATAADQTPPTQPTGLTAAATGTNQVTLVWNASTDDTAVAGYTIRRNGTVVTSTNSTATTYPDIGLSPGTTYSYTIDAYDAAGNHSPQSVAASATTTGSTSVQHYEYVFPANAIDVYDMDNGMRLVKTISLPAARDIRGAVASPTTHILYVSYGGDGGSNGNGSMLAYDLVSDRILWTQNYSTGVDSMAITPDGKTIYMPTGEAAPGSSWSIIDAATGNVTGAVSGGTAPHNTIVSLNGKDVYMGGRNASFLTVADTATNTVFRQIGPLKSGTVRPFTINGKETLAFTTATGFLGFQVSDITTGKVLYTVPITGPFPYTPGQAGPTSPSHGISLSPDERELWVIDQPNSYLHVFDVSGLPASAPVQVADIKLKAPMTGNQVGCTYDCLREGWLQHSLDGRYVWVGDSGDVISTSTRASVANLTPLYNTRVFLEIDWSGGVPVATSSRSGVGYVTH